MQQNNSEKASRVAFYLVIATLIIILGIFTSWFSSFGPTGLASHDVGAMAGAYSHPDTTIAASLFANGSVNGTLIDTTTYDDAQNITLKNLTSNLSYITVLGLFNESAVDLSKLTIYTNGTHIAANLSVTSGIESRHDLYLGNDNGGKGVYICPAATQLFQVNLSCPDITILPTITEIRNSYFTRLGLRKRIDNESTNIAINSRYDESSGTNATDSSGNNANASLRYDAVITTEGIKGNGVVLDGFEDHIRYNGATGFDSINWSGNLTFEVWFNPAQNFTDSSLSSSKTFFSQWHRFLLWYRTAGTFRFRTDTLGVCSPCTNDSKQINLSQGTWHHIVATYEPNTSNRSISRVYLDGKPIISNIRAPGVLSTSGTTLRVGIRFDNGGLASSESLNGTVDEFAAYNRLLTEEEIRERSQYRINNLASGTALYPGDPVNITINKTASTGTVSSGEFIDYTIIINNSGNGTATNITVQDLFSDNVTFVESTPEPDTTANNTWTFPAITGYKVKHVNITVRARLGLSGGSTITNFANVTFTNSTLSQVTKSSTFNMTVTNTPGNAQPELFKGGEPTPVTNGTFLYYAIFINASGNGTAYNVTLEEFYDPNSTFVNATPPPDVGNDTWFLRDIATGGDSYTVNITVRVKPEVENGTLIINRANITVSNSTGGKITFPEGAQNNVSLPIKPEINITKNATTATVANGSQVNYTIIINNTGQGKAISVFVVDTITANLTYNNASITPVLLNSTTVAFGFGNVSNDTAIKINISFFVNDSVVNGTIIDNPVQVVYENLTDERMDMYTENITIIVPAAPPRINLTKTANQTIVLNGSLLNYTLVINSSGSTTAVNVTLRDILPTNVTFVSASPVPNATNSTTLTWLLSNISIGTIINISLIINVSVNLTSGSLLNTINATFQSISGSQFSTEVTSSTTVTTPAVPEPEPTPGGGNAPPKCEDECSKSSPKICSTGSGDQTHIFGCGNYDSDKCLEYGEEITCDYGCYKPDRGIVYCKECDRWKTVPCRDGYKCEEFLCVVGASESFFKEPPKSLGDYIEEAAEESKPKKEPVPRKPQPVLEQIKEPAPTPLAKQVPAEKGATTFIENKTKEVLQEVYKKVTIISWWMWATPLFLLLALLGYLYYRHKKNKKEKKKKKNKEIF